MEILKRITLLRYLLHNDLTKETKKSFACVCQATDNNNETDITVTKWNRNYAMPEQSKTKNKTVAAAQQRPSQPPAVTEAASNAAGAHSLTLTHTLWLTLSHRRMLLQLFKSNESEIAIAMLF